MSNVRNDFGVRGKAEDDADCRSVNNNKICDIDCSFYLWPATTLLEPTRQNWYGKLYGLPDYDTRAKTRQASR